MTVVADSTPCIYLARLGDLGILQKLFGRIVLPEAVWRELTVEGHLPGAREFQAALDRWVTVQTTRQADLDGSNAVKWRRSSWRENYARKRFFSMSNALSNMRDHWDSPGTPSIYVAARNAGWIDSVRER